MARFRWVQRLAPGRVASTPLARHQVGYCRFVERTHV